MADSTAFAPTSPKSYYESTRGLCNSMEEGAGVNIENLKGVAIGQASENSNNHQLEFMELH